MNLSGLPEAAFVDPGGVNRASVDALAGRALNLVLSLASEASSRSPLPEGEDASDVGVVREAPVPEGELLEELRGLLVRSMNAAHPAVQPIGPSVKRISGTNVRRLPACP